MNADVRMALLGALWDVCDAAKTHVSLLHGKSTNPRLAFRAASSPRRIVDASLDALTAALTALAAVTAGHDEKAPVMVDVAAYVATDNVVAMLTCTADAAKVYALRAATYRARGTGRADRDWALVALLKELDVVTFYRTGPSLRETHETEGASCPA